MKKVILLRHGKSSHSDPSLNDHERPLKERGMHDAFRIGTLLKGQGIIPNLLLVSSAIRTKQTAHLLLKSFECASKVDPSLYHASPISIETLLRRQSDDMKCIGVVGHNPILTDIIQSTGFTLENLPTAGAAVLTLEKCESWKDMRFQDSYVSNLIMPKENIL